jgi:hypothetical protein
VSHRQIDTDVVHDTVNDVTEVHPDLDSEQVEVLQILGWCTACGPARLTLRQWQVVDRLIAWRDRPPALPCPRTSPEESRTSA